MAYRKIDQKIWNDAKFCSLSDNGKLAFLFLLTHPHMTSLGAMRATMAGLGAELGWSQEAFTKAFREASAKGMAKHDERAFLVWLPNFIKYNKPESPNVLKAWVAAVDLIPECPMKYEVIQAVVSLAGTLSEAFQKALPEAFGKAMPNQEQEQEQEQDRESITSAPAVTDSPPDLLPDAPPEEPPPKPEKVPHQAVADLFNELLPELPAVKLLNDKRQAGIRRLHRGIMNQDLDAWRAYFARVRKSDFLMGRTKDWRASFDFLLTDKAVTGVIEGKYHGNAADRQTTGLDPNERGISSAERTRRAREQSRLAGQERAVTG